MLERVTFGAPEEVTYAVLAQLDGTTETPLDRNDWASLRAEWRQKRNDPPNIERFSRRPSMGPGDRLIHYAVGSYRHFSEGRIYAVSEVISEPQQSNHDRWPWQVCTRDVQSGPLLERCPTIADIQVSGGSLRSQSYIRLTDEQGERAEELISKAAGEFGALTKGL